MNCLDCHLGGSVTPAVAVCHHCGAAVCGEHAMIAPLTLSRVEPVNVTVPVEPPARRVHCAVCAAALAAQAAPHARPHPFPRHH